MRKWIDGTAGAVVWGMCEGLSPAAWVYHQATAKKAQIDDRWVIDQSVLYSLSGPGSWQAECLGRGNRWFSQAIKCYKQIDIPCATKPDWRWGQLYPRWTFWQFSTGWIGPDISRCLRC
jgi:hypothetical protein